MTVTTATGGNSNPPTFPDEFLFNGTNYITFRDRILLVAQLKGAEGYLEGSVKEPTSKMTISALATTEWWDPSPSPQEWRVRNTWALALIVYNLKNPIGLGIKMTDTTEKAWSTLKEMYRTISDLGANLAENTLGATKYMDGMDFAEHITDLRSKWNNATEWGADIKDNQFRAIIILSLPATWDYIVASLQSTKTSIKLVAGLILHWEQIKECLTATGTTSTALYTKTPQPQKKLVCVNPNCGRTGHTIDNCYWKGRGKEGQFPANFG